MIYIFFLFFAQLIAADENPELPLYSKRYPDLLLTSDYGILSETDLITNLLYFYPIIYSPDRFSVTPRWQCFPTKAVTPSFRTWKDYLATEYPSHELCDLHINAEYEGLFHQYAERRAYESFHCYEFMKKWKKITDGEKYVCLSGEYGDYWPEKSTEMKKTVISWTWDKIKTKKECMEYFGSPCLPDNWESELKKFPLDKRRRITANPFYPFYPDTLIDFPYSKK